MEAKSDHIPSAIPRPGSMRGRRRMPESLVSSKPRASRNRMCSRRTVNANALMSQASKRIVTPTSNASSSASNQSQIAQIDSLSALNRSLVYQLLLARMKMDSLQSQLLKTSELSELLPVNAWTANPMHVLIDSDYFFPLRWKFAVRARNTTSKFTKPSKSYLAR
ncbi:hypothetical protein BC830DRAFT_1172830 [Chytriomyces sp. MP71]|nr:hypothetical protein BC830DRAFT_1172830 [Chytriomyces sp. MP71]